MSLGTLSRDQDCDISKLFSIRLSLDMRERAIAISSLGSTCDKQAAFTKTSTCRAGEMMVQLTECTACNAAAFGPLTAAATGADQLLLSAAHAPHPPSS